MELREFMEKENISEDDMVKAASIVTKVCDTWKCEKCPYYNYKICYAKGVKGDMVGIVKARIKKLLHPSHMEKVAKLLGVKFGEPFKIAYNNEGIISGYFHLEKTGLYCDESLRAPFNLTALLVGDAYIVKKEESKDE